MLLDAKKLADNGQGQEHWIKQPKGRLQELTGQKLEENQAEAITIQKRLTKHQNEILLFL